MSYRIINHKQFDKEFKRLAKRYRSLKADYVALLEELQAHPETGVLIAPSIRKVRMSIASKGKGKSHGARIITHTALTDKPHTDEADILVQMEDGVITLLTIYDKAEQATITDAEIELLIREL